MTTQANPAPIFRRDKTGGEQYHKLPDRPVAYSVELADLVIADYDETGAVRGMEFVGRQTVPVSVWIEKARKASRGPLTARPKIPG